MAPCKRAAATAFSSRQMEFDFRGRLFSVGFRAETSKGGSNSSAPGGMVVDHTTLATRRKALKLSGHDQTDRGRGLPD
jgi:hypothetical protein